MDLDRERVEHVPGQLTLDGAAVRAGGQLDLLPALPDPETTSADRRRTARQRRLLDLGVHPLTGGRAHPEAGTCGGCPHRRPGAYPKCKLGPVTRGPGTDVRAWWPACHRHPAARPAEEPTA